MLMMMRGSRWGDGGWNSRVGLLSAAGLVSCCKGAIAVLVFMMPAHSFEEHRAIFTCT
jgi:hypothetical protein